MDSNLYETGKVVLKKGGFIETYIVNETTENVWPAWPEKAGLISLPY